MKKIASIFALLIAALMQLNAQNPYAALGIEEKVLHYDDGHKEMFDLDSVKAIGYAVYSPETGLLTLYDLKDSLVAMQKIDPAKMARFLSVDPITSQYPELTPYQFASNTPIMAIDLDGLEAKVVFDKYYNNMHILPNLKVLKAALPYKYVNAFDYNKLTKQDHDKYNYGIKIDNVFTGGHYDKEKETIVYNDPSRPNEKPISTGMYNILENKGNDNPNHMNFLVLDPVDKYQYDKIDDRYGEKNWKEKKRDGYNWHPGQVSWGCVTACIYDKTLTLEQRNREWNIIYDAVTNTELEYVKDNRGYHQYMLQEQKKFGILEVIDSRPLIDVTKIINRPKAIRIDDP